MSLPSGLRWIDAGNAGPFTHEGTRTHIVGRRRVAVVDPGPGLDAHVEAVAAAVRGAESVVLLLTHGHADHAGAAPALSRRLGAPVLGAWGVGEAEGASAHPGPPPELPFRPLDEGEWVPTDAGRLVALHTPGHAREHLVFHWPEADAAFVGDLILGTGDTTWVGGYRGCVSDYLGSLERVDGLGARLLLPAHGPPVADPDATVERFRAHRRARIAQVEAALAEAPGAGLEELLRRVYPGVPPGLEGAARASLEALVEHVTKRRR